ncbi:MAG: hypothetical protein ACK5NA_02035 [Enterococcus sp.]
MNEGQTAIEIGKRYICKPIGLKHEVVGFVEQVYTNTVLVSIEEYNPSDRTAVIECQNKVLVKYTNVYDSVPALVG